MRIFERGNERVEIEVVERTVVVRHARNGLIEETSSESSSEPKAKWDADRAAAELVAQGFVRVGGAAIAPSQDELIARLATDPADLDTYLVLSDWLSERGDPWGLVMAVQIAIAQLPRFTPAARRDELAREDALLLFKHAARLWGALGDTIVNADTQTYALDRLRPEWHCGFVRAIATDGEGLAQLRALAQLDVARLLQGIAIEADVWADDVFAPLVDTSWPQLRTLTIHGQYAEPEYVWRRLRGEPTTPGTPEIDCAALAPIVDGTHAPRLAALAISYSRNTDALCHALAASPVAPQLRSIALHASQLTDAGISALAGAQLDALEELVITGIGPPHGAARLRGKASHVRVALDAQRAAGDR